MAIRVTLSSMNALERNAAQKINDLLELFPVVVILGARQVGKTTLCRQLRPQWKYMDLEKPSVFERLSEHGEFFCEQHPQDVIFDEAQCYPVIFNILRGVIDAKRQQKGRYLITGSSSPELLKQATESLAGRVAIVELGTLKANEYYLQPLSAFYQLFSSVLDKKNLVQGTPPLEREQVQQVWLRGGYPEPSTQANAEYYQLWMDSYRDTYVQRDLAQLFPTLNKQAYQRFLAMLCKLSGTIINRSDLARAVEVSEATIRNYLQIAAGTFIWRSLPSFEKNIIKSVIKMPKGHIRDSGLLHHLLRISDIEQLYQNPIVGCSFEGFVIEEILKGLTATKTTNWQAHYYRTRNGAKTDLILEGNFGLLPIEIKYGNSVQRRQLKTLEDFVKEQQLPFGMVINQSSHVEWLTEQIVQMPVGWL